MVYLALSFQGNEYPPVGRRASYRAYRQLQPVGDLRTVAEESWRPHELNVRTGSSYGMAWGTYGGEIESAGIPTVWQFTALIMCMTCWSRFL